MYSNAFFVLALNPRNTKGDSVCKSVPATRSIHIPIEMEEDKSTIMRPCRILLYVPFCTGLLIMAGCGSSSSTNCTVTALNVTPATATADHTAAAPGNSQQFAASNLFTGNGVCTANASAPVSSNWTVSDPSVHLSAAQGPTVTATCTAALASPAAIHAVAVNNPSLAGQASLSCQ